MSTGRSHVTRQTAAKWSAAESVDQSAGRPRLLAGAASPLGSLPPGGDGWRRRHLRPCPTGRPAGAAADGLRAAVRGVEPRGGVVTVIPRCSQAPLCSQPPGIII